MTRQETVKKHLSRARNAKTGIRIKNIRVKQSRLSPTRRQVIFIFLMLCMLMVSGIGYVWSNYERTQIGYDLSQLKKEEMRLREINRKLRVELALLKSPQYLEELAIHRLGLRQPSREQIVVLP